MIITPSSVLTIVEETPPYSAALRPATSSTPDIFCPISSGLPENSMIDTTTGSAISPSLVAVCAKPTRPTPRRERAATSRPSRLSATRLVQLGINRAGRLRGHPGSTLQLLLRRRQHALGRPEMTQQRPAARRADALERVEDRLARPRVPALTVEADREAVGFVADPLQELEPGRVRIEPDRIGPPRQEDLLDPLRQRDHCHSGQVEALHRGQRGRELTLPAVDHDQVRHCREALVVFLVVGGAHPRKTAFDHLRHRRKVVLAVETAHSELAVVRLLRRRILKDDHRADRLGGLDVRNVEALDPQRQAFEVQRLAQLLERLDPPQPLLLGLVALRVEGEPRVLRRQLLQPPLLAALGRPHLDAGAPALAQELLERGDIARVPRYDDLRRH